MRLSCGEAGAVKLCWPGCDASTSNSTDFQIKAEQKLLQKQHVAWERRGASSKRQAWMIEVEKTGAPQSARALAQEKHGDGDVLAQG